MYPFRDNFTIIKKGYFFNSMLNLGNTNSCYRRKGNVSACRSGKNKLLRGQIIIANVTLESAPWLFNYYLNVYHLWALYDDVSVSGST